MQRGAHRSLEEKERIIDFIKLAQHYKVKIQTACILAGISVKSYYNWQNHSKDDKRNGPNVVQNKLSEDEVASVLKTICKPEYCDSAPYQIYNKLLDDGKYYCSESTMYRLMKKSGLNAFRSTSKKRRKNVRKKPILIANKPNQVWSWDITYLKTDIKGRYYYLYMVIDIFSRFIVAGYVYEYESGETAAEFMNSAYLNVDINNERPIIHSDNGSPMRSGNLRTTLESLGVAPSFSRPRTSNDNPFSEAAFKTLKYVPDYPKSGFSSMEEANEWVEKFINWYNNEHMHSGIKYCTPSQRHQNKDKEVLRKRREVLEEARSEKPNRWIKKKVRNLDYISEVSINKEKDKKIIA